MSEIKSVSIGGTSYDIVPRPATTSALGAVKIGEGIDVKEDGTISILTNFTITYNLNGGTAFNPTTYTKKDRIVLVAPVKTGYTFTGWTGSNGDTPQVEVTIAAGTTGNLEFTANYTINKYIVTFSIDGVTSTEQVNYGSTVSAPTDPAKIGYTFNNWSLNNAAFDFSTPITESITLVATWNLITYNITYTLNGGTTSNPATYNIETSTFTLNNPTKEHYDFTGWTGSNGNTPQTVVQVVQGSYGDLNFTANYEGETITVTFNIDGVTSTESVGYGDTVTRPTDPTKTGYDFAGWALSGNAYDFSTPVTGAITLVATWTLHNYTITYVLNDGTLSDSNPSTYNIETATFTLNNPTKEHYNFTGWTGSNGNTPQTTVTISQGSTGDKTYTANFEVETFTVIYKTVVQKSNGNVVSESTLSSEQVPYGGTVSNVPILTNISNYTSDLLWYESDKTTLFNSSTTITADRTVYGIYIAAAIIYGFKIATNDSNPDTRVTYTDAAVGMTPAHMDYENNEFNYGDWSNVWFIKDNYPVALRFNGTEDYRLDPNDYSKKLDGTASDWTSTSYGGNFMSAMPKVYFYRYNETVGDTTYRCCKISNEKIDSNYQCYAHIGQDGNEKDYVYLPMFKGCYVNNVIRSIGLRGPDGNASGGHSGDKIKAEANGAGWQLWDYSMREMIIDLLILISKSTNTQDKFGTGVINGRANPTDLSTRGQFYGTTGSASVKVFHIKDFWGWTWEGILGVLLNNGQCWIKPYPPYVLDSTCSETYTLCNITLPNSGMIKNGIYVNNYGFLPTETGGSSSTYECDWVYTNLSGFGGYFMNGSWDDTPADKGAFTSALGSSVTYGADNNGGSCAYRKA